MHYNSFNTLNVLLVSFNFCRDDENPDPYGISCLKTAFNNSPLKQKNDTISSLVIDLNKSWTNIDIIEQIITSVRNTGCNILALSNFIWADQIIKISLPIIKKEFPYIKILMGGPMVTGTEFYLKSTYPQVDLFTKSFGEAVFADLRTTLNLNQTVIELLPEFTSIYSPYLTNEIKLKEGMSVRMETRRGCVFNCSYCRHRNANCKVYNVGTNKRAYEELKLFTKAHVRKINVLDPFFNDINNRDMTKAKGLNFLKTCQELGVNAELSLQIRPEMINSHYLETASQMKNVTFEIGIQSLDKNVYPYIRRGNQNARDFILEKLQQVQEHNINTEITLIYGLPNQTFTSFAKDIEVLKKIGFSNMKAFPLQIYPATEIMNTYQAHGLKVKNVAPFGILEVYDNPAHDFSLMQKLADTL